MKEEIIKEFRQIPGVGKIIAEDFWDIGLRSIADLKNRDPEELYQSLCTYQNCKVDRCMLYVIRLAVYYASEPDPEPELLKWWNWKEITPPQ